MSRRHLQRLLYAHADDPIVQRDRLLSDAVKWEQQGARTLAEAASRATAWLRQATSNPTSDPREVAAAFSSTIAAGHRLAESGARRARRLQPEQPQQQNRFDHQAFLAAVADGCAQVRALPEAQQEAGWERLREQLRSDQQEGQALEPIDVEAMPAKPEQSGPVSSPLI